MLTIDELPRQMLELPHENPFWEVPDRDVKWRVPCSFAEREVSLTAAELSQIPGLEDLCLFRGPQMGTNSPVSPAQGALLLSLIKRRKSSPAH